MFYPYFNVIVIVSILPILIIEVEPCTICTLNGVVACSIGINLIWLSKRNLHKEWLWIDKGSSPNISTLKMLLVFSLITIYLYIYIAKDLWVKWFCHFPWKYNFLSFIQLLIKSHIPLLMYIKDLLLNLSLIYQLML